MSSSRSQSQRQHQSSPKSSNHNGSSEVKRKTEYPISFIWYDRDQTAIHGFTLLYQSDADAFNMLDQGSHENGILILSAICPQGHTDRANAIGDKTGLILTQISQSFVV